MDGISPVLVFLVLAVAVWWFFGRSSAPMADVLAAIDAGAPVVDVRSAGEFASGHVTGAVNVPVDQLGTRISELGPPGKVVIYCASGMRSSRAASILKAAGFDVIDAKRVSSFPAERLSR